MQHNGLHDLLPDALAEVLGRGVADCRREWASEVRMMGADHAKFVAELRAANLEHRAEYDALLWKRMNDALEAQARRSDEIIETQAKKIQDLIEEASQAAALVKDGSPGERGADGPPGRDADPERVKELVLYTVAEQLPEMVQRSVATEIAKLPSPERGPPGNAGPAGKDADPDLVKNMVLDETFAVLPELVQRSVTAEVAKLPPPERGPSGHDADPQVIKLMVDEAMTPLPDLVHRAVNDAVSNLPPAKDGATGPRGERGSDGIGLVHIKQMGDDLVILKSDGTEQIFADIRGPAGSMGERGLIGEKGDIGSRGEIGPLGPSGEKGEMGPPGPMGERGVPGVGEKGAIGPEGPPGRDGRDGQVGLPGQKGLDGADGVNGHDGVDGLGFDDLQVVTNNDGREIVLRFAHGERVKEFSVEQPIMLYRDVYRADAEYKRGDCVTFGGSMWVAMKNTSSKPGTNEDWRLAVKHGRDGRDRVEK